ncbi:MAG: hypothetical protein AAFV53_12335 [Myxococcota bacterium]
MSTLTAQDRALLEDGTLSLDGVRSAWERRDPRLAEYLVKLVALDPGSAELRQAVEEQKPNYIKTFSVLSNTYQLNQLVNARDPALPGQSGYSRRRRQQTIAGVHHDQWKIIEAAPASDTLPDRLKTYTLIEEIWNDGGAYARSVLMQLIREVPLKWGPWRGLKRIFKRSIEREDWSIFGALVARLEVEIRRHRVPQNSYLRNPLLPNPDNTEQLQQVNYSGNAEKPLYTRNFYWDDSRSRTRDVSERTLEYLLRRTLRVFWSIARAQPELYAFVAAEVLSQIPKGHYLARIGRIQDHDPELWALNSAPLFQMIERSDNDNILDFAFTTLEQRFRQELKSADPNWILRLATSPRRKARRLAVRWFLEPLSGYEQGRYHELGLQAAVLTFLDYDDDKSNNNGEYWDSWDERDWMSGWAEGDNHSTTWPALARQYALDYIKANYKVIASDLPLEKVMWLLRSEESSYRTIGEFLLYPGEDTSPYDDQLDLSFWTELLEDTRTFTLAERAIRRKFSGAELSADWYADRLLSAHKSVRELALGFLRDDTRFRVDDDWFSFHQKIVRSHEAQQDILQRSLYQLARKDDDGNSLLPSLSIEFLRMLLVHPKAACHQSIIGWVEGGRIKTERLGVSFLKHLATKSDWTARGWLAGLSDEKQDGHDELDYIPAVGESVRRWLRTTATLEAIGYDWVLARVEKFQERDHNFIRDVFRREMPFSRLADDPDADDAAAKGLHKVLETILAEKDAGSIKANFYKKFIRARHALIRKDEDPNLPALDDGLEVPRSALTFDWFERMSVDEREQNRKFAMGLADFELARWTDATPLTFQRLKPLLRDAYHDIRRHLVRSMTAPRRIEGRLDLERPQFEVEELYGYCFDANRELREIGMEIIVRLPQRFGQPEQLLQLSESTDRRVRELVIEVIWRQFRSMLVTEEWQPFERSVVPQSLSLSRSQRVVALPIPPPDGMKAEDARSNRKYLGQGVPRQAQVELKARQAFETFVRSVLFQIPPVRQSPKLPPRPQPLEVAWRNKRTLITAVRDLGVKERSFAEFILPILKEFQHVRGKMVRDACLTARAYLMMAHPDLPALEDNA